MVRVADSCNAFFNINRLYSCSNARDDNCCSSVTIGRTLCVTAADISLGCGDDCDGAATIDSCNVLLGTLYVTGGNISASDVSYVTGDGDTRGLTLTNGNNCEDCVTLCVDFIVGNIISDVNICLNVQAIVGCSNVVSRNEASSGNNVENTAEERDDNDCGGTFTKGNCDDSIIGGTDCWMNCSMSCCNAKSAETRDDC